MMDQEAPMRRSDDRLTIHVTDLVFRKRGMMGSSCGKCLAGAVVPARLFRALRTKRKINYRHIELFRGAHLRSRG